ncbi:unnamed protein product [Aureobasidium pullulans]|nr:unnamed protein product [Aureobasidium pullulans]
MRSTFLIPALVAVVAALPAPNPQEIDLDLIINVPTPTIIQATGTPDQIVTYDTKAILASATAVSSISVDITDVATSTPSIVKRAACGPEPSGYGPVTTNPKDDAASFAANPVYANAANSAANLNASSSAYGYMGYTNLKEYNPQTCATKSCPNPASLTQIRCVYWGGPVTAGNTNNYGRKWEQFSNIAAPSGYSDATYLNNAAINAPYDALGYNTYMGAKVFATGPFNATLCAEACNAQNVYNIANPPADGAPVQTCQFFNTYLLFLNNTQALGQYCAMYSSAWTSKYATKVEQWRGNDRYTVQFSYSFSNITNPGTTPNKAAAVAQAKEEIAYFTLQGYCSTLLAYNDMNAYVTATSTKSPVSTVTTTTTLKIKASSSSSSSSSAKISSSSSSLKASSLSKRAVASAVSTPAGLTKYPASVLSSACSALVTSVPKTATVTVSTATVTGATSRSTVIKTITTTTH